MVARPADPAERILGIDALRGIALCGILLINIFDMGGPVAMDRPITVPTMNDPDWQVWTIAQLFVSGTMRGLFSMLFGVGLVLFLDRGPAAQRMPLYIRRLGWLFLFGIVDSTLLLWPGDILLVYAMAGAILLMLYRLDSARLIAIAATTLIMLSIWSALEASAIVYADTVYSPAMMAREGAARLGGYADNLAYMSVVAWAWTVNAFTLRWIGDAAAFMLIGVVLQRRGLFAADVNLRLVRWITVLGYAVGLSLRAAHTLSILGHEGTPTIVSALIDQPGRLAMTLGHYGLFVLLWRRRAMRRACAPLVQMGRMALTLYLGQSACGALLFAGFGLGLWNSLSWPQLWGVAAAVLVGQAIFASLWLRRYRYGPMEWLWRRGTYGKRPSEA